MTKPNWSLYCNRASVPLWYAICFSADLDPEKALCETVEWPRTEEIFAVIMRDRGLSNIELNGDDINLSIKERFTHPVLKKRFADIDTHIRAKKLPFIRPVIGLPRMMWDTDLIEFALWVQSATDWELPIDYPWIKVVPQSVGSINVTLPYITEDLKLLFEFMRLVPNQGDASLHALREIFEKNFKGKHSKAKRDEISRLITSDLKKDRDKRSSRNRTH